MGITYIFLFNMKFYSWVVALMGAAYGPEQIDEFLQGLLIGLVKSDDLDQIKACLKDSTVISTDLKAAITEI